MFRRVDFAGGLTGSLFDSLELGEPADWVVVRLGVLGTRWAVGGMRWGEEWRGSTEALFELCEGLTGARTEEDRRREGVKPAWRRPGAQRGEAAAPLSSAEEAAPESDTGAP